MKIAIVAHNAFPISQPYGGGLEMFTDMLCEKLVEFGHEVVLYALQSSDFDTVVSFEELTCAIHDYQFKDKATYTMMMYSQAYDHIASEGFDIVHNNSLHYTPIIANNLLDIPTVTTLHTPIFPELYVGVKSTRSNRQQYVMVSKSLQDTWRDIIPESKVIYNGIDLDSWEYIAKNSGDYCFWYGRICKEKAPHHAIQACIKAGVKIVIAGPESNEEYFLEKVKPYLDNEFVTYIGHRSHEELNPIIGNALCTFFTSMWDEPYGLCMAESLACGTPVIAYDSGASSEIITSESGIILPKGQVDLLSASIAEVKFIERAKCRERAERFCDINNVVQQYEELYQNLLKNGVKKPIKNDSLLCS